MWGASKTHTRGMASLANIEILLISSAPETLVSVRKALDGRGCTLHESRNARHAVDLAEEVIPHLVICDLAMLANGAETFLKERSRRRFLANTPVMLLGDAAHREKILRGLMLGASDCLL